jgi:hypothetical protein
MKLIFEQILFDGNNRAIGVQFNFKDQRKYAFASKEVVLSAGAIGSPHLLMLSGIGPKDHLRAHKVEFMKYLSLVASLFCRSRSRLPQICAGLDQTCKTTSRQVLITWL